MHVTTDSGAPSAAVAAATVALVARAAALAFQLLEGHDFRKKHVDFRHQQEAGATFSLQLATHPI